MIGVWAIGSTGDASSATRKALVDLVAAAGNKGQHALVYEHAGAPGGLKQPHYLLVAEDPRGIAKLAPQDLDVVAQGAFESTGNLPQPTDVQTSNGLLVGLTDVASPDQLDAFNEWYENTHAADVVRSPYYWRARRFKCANGTLPEYLALYDTATTEPDTFNKYLKWPERDATMCDACLVRHVWTFNRITETA